MSKCETCKFWAKSSNPWQHVAPCTRHAPFKRLKVEFPGHYEDYNRANGEWPTTDAEWFCGDWEQRPEVVIPSDSAAS